MLKEFKNLKLIAARCTGVDLIDFNFRRNHGITVCNVPAYAEMRLPNMFLLLNLQNSNQLGYEYWLTRIDQDCKLLTVYNKEENV